MKVPAGLTLACWLLLLVVSTLARPQLNSLTLDAKDADPNSDAFKKAFEEAKKQAKLELGVTDSAELGLGGGDLASLFGRRRRKRQLFGGGGNSSTAQTLGNAVSTGAGIFGSTLGVLFDTTWEALINFIRGSETISLLAVDQITALMQEPDEDKTE